MIRITILMVCCSTTVAVAFADEKYVSSCVVGLTYGAKTTISSDLKTFLVGSLANRDLTSADIHEIEKSFSDPITANGSYLSYMQFLAKAGFDPAQYQNKLVVDLGSGLSNFTDYLASNGVKSFGVDFIYHPRYLKAVQVDFKQIFTKYFEDFNTDTNPGVNDYQIDFSRRIAGSLTNLPFHDNSVDAIVSQYAFIYLHGRPLSVATKEMLRVLKPSGTAFLYVDKCLGTEPLLDKLGVERTSGVSQCGTHWMKIYKRDLAKEI